jgi:hypothetical protein
MDVLTLKLLALQQPDLVLRYDTNERNTGSWYTHAYCCCVWWSNNEHYNTDNHHAVLRGIVVHDGDVPDDETCDDCRDLINAPANRAAAQQLRG